MGNNSWTGVPGNAMRGKIAKCELKGKRISQNPDGQNQQVGKSGGIHFKPPASATQPPLSWRSLFFRELEPSGK